MSRSTLRRVLLPAALVTLLIPAAGAADEIVDSLQGALEAYEAGDIQYALEELAVAQQRLNAKKTEQLAGFLPEAPQGWTREVSTEAAAGIAMFGGGSSAEAHYSGPESSFDIKIMADNPMIAIYAGMFGNPQLMAQTGTVHRIGRERALEQNGELTMLVGGRFLIQASGGELEQMLGMLGEIDFRGLSGFGS